MKKLIEGLTGGYSSSARVVDGTLILSLPDAISPVVWRMDMGNAKASAMEVRTNEDKTFTLVLKTPRGDVNEIAPFATKAQAVKALMAVSAAMEHAHGQLRAPGANDPAASAPPPVAGTRSAKDGSGKLLAGVVAVILLVGLIALLAGAGSRGPSPHGPAAAGSRPGALAPAAGVAAPVRPGQPVSADDFLRGR